MNYALNTIKKYDFEYEKKNPDEYEVDKILTKQILHHIQIFFNKKLGNSITKMSRRFNNITLKNRRK
jgi:hypothetical protein